MRAQHQILGNLRENKDDWYYLCNDAEQLLFKVKEQCKDERAIKTLERMIIELNSIRMEQYNALNEYDFIFEEENTDDLVECSVTIYQIKDIANCDYAFRSYDEAGSKINMDDYEAVASIVLPKKGTTNDLLEEVFMLGNTNKDAFTIHGKFRSISVSDIIELDNEAYYVDSFGFKKIK